MYNLIYYIVYIIIGFKYFLIDILVTAEFLTFKLCVADYWFVLF